MPAQRKTANDFDQELLDLYDYYVHGQIDRRAFLDRAAGSPLPMRRRTSHIRSLTRSS